MQSHYQFIQFKNTRGERNRSETISIARSGYLYFSQAFCEKYTISPYAKIAYDPEKKAIAIIFVEKPIKNVTFKVTRTRKGDTTISIATFLKINSILDYGQYYWKKHHIEGEGEAFVIDLKERE